MPKSVKWWRTVKIAVIKSIISKLGILFLDELFYVIDEKGELKSIDLLDKKLKIR